MFILQLKKEREIYAKRKHTSVYYENYWKLHKDKLLRETFITFINVVYMLDPSLSLLASFQNKQNITAIIHVKK